MHPQALSVLAPTPFVNSDVWGLEVLQMVALDTADLDAAIIAEYSRFNTPADQIVSDPALNTRFAEAVNSRLPANCRADRATINKRLLNLRRRGEDNGGLPRLRRGYNGRGPNRPR